jgi:hypothetical protein
MRQLACDRERVFAVGGLAGNDRMSTGRAANTPRLSRNAATT